MERHEQSGDFESLSWHDNIVYGVRFDVGDNFRGDWHRDLVLDIDHIVEWICGGGVLFRVAPATLTFHHVTDLRIAIDWGDSGDQMPLHELSIAAITREQVQDRKNFLDWPHFRWRIAFNWPDGGEITFAPAASARSCGRRRSSWTSSGWPPRTGRSCRKLRRRIRF